MVQAYNASTIQVLEGLVAVRKRPGMYIGTTGLRGLHHLIHEIVDNSVDEAMAGYATRIDVTLGQDGSVQVIDNGRGIPVDLHASGVPALELVMTRLHAGGKFGGGGYRVSGGLHGVGAAVVNALSSRLIVQSFRDGHLFRQCYDHGGAEISPLEDLGPKSGRGTTVLFWPDPAIFPVTAFDRETVAQRLKEVAYLNAGLTLTLTDKRLSKDSESYSETFCYSDGLEGFAEELLDGNAALAGPIRIKGDSDGAEVDAVLVWTRDGYSETTLSYANSVPTIDGGTHEAGLRAAITRVINDYARSAHLLRDRAPNLQGDDIREGIKVILAIKLEDPMFEGQTKGKLGTAAAKGIVESVVTAALSDWLEGHPSAAAALIQKAIRAMEAREAAKKARDFARSGKKREAQILGGKLAPAQAHDPAKCELFLVEGDSAGGSAKQARDRRFQAILPLRGKPLNTENLSTSQALRNEELATLVHAIGTGIGESFDIQKCNYAHIVILSDADSDGGHIQALLLTFFYRHMRELIADGHIYVAKPPLYRIATASEAHYVWDEAELKAIRRKLGAKAIVTRFKGLGEMPAVQLRESALDPATRKLVAVSVEDASAAERTISLLMNEGRAADRRTWIAAHVPMEAAEGVAR